MNNSYIKISDNNNGIVRVTLNRPKIHNAFDEVLIAQLTSTFRDLDNDNSVRVVILDAAGKSFSAGADLNWMKRMSNYSQAENYEDSQHLADLMSSLYRMKCPTIAAVQGAAYGGGVGLVACCDIAISSDNASFCLSEVKLGLIPAVISPYVVRAMGERAAKRYFITAESFDASRACELGLISEIVLRAELEAKVIDVAELILNNGPEAVIEAKQLINDITDNPINEKLKLMTSSRIASIRASTQGKEGVNAFLDKREADWDQE